PLRARVGVRRERHAHEARAALAHRPRLVAAEAVLLHARAGERERFAGELAAERKQQRDTAAHVLRRVIERRTIEVQDVAIADAQRGHDRAALRNDTYGHI